MKKLAVAVGVSSILALSSFAYAAAPAPDEVAGFEEFPIGDEVTVGPLHISGVYVQPVDIDRKSVV